MKTRLLYFLIGLASGLIAWLVTDRVQAHLNEQRYLEEMAKYEASEFLEDQPELDVDALLDLELKNARTGEEQTMRISQDRVIFLNLWATWCAPCLRELPSIAALQERMGDEVDFYLLSDEQDQVAVRRFAQDQDDRLSYYVYTSAGTTLEPFIRKGIPRTLVIHGGEVIIDHLGAAPWDSEKVVERIEGALGR